MNVDKRMLLDKLKCLIVFLYLIALMLPMVLCGAMICKYYNPLMEKISQCSVAEIPMNF